LAPVSPDVDRDLQQLRMRLLRGELERRRPPRKLGRRPQLLAQREVVDFDDDAVGVELEAVPFLGPLAAELDERARPPATAAASAASTGRPSDCIVSSVSPWVIFRLKAEAT
jgi:hypothetical protein